ncbi:MAG: hypothetical protein AB7V62_16760 [Thermoleophilia bacterium]
MDDLDSRIDALYGGPPGEFTAARDALAKELRAAGEREEADRIKGLRRPTRIAAELNRLARERPGAMADAIVAAEALAEAQEELLAGKGGAEALRAAGDREAEAVAALSPDPAVRAAVRAAARSAPTREDLRRGRLNADPDPGGGDGLFAAAPAPAPQRRAPAPRKAAPDPDEDAPPDDLAAARARRERQKALDEARRLVRAAGDEERATAETLAAAEAATTEATAARDAARTALREAEEAAAAAGTRVEEASAHEAEARAVAEAAAETARQAREALAGIEDPS